MRTEKVCQYCNKVIDGLSESQAEHLLNQHIISKHMEQVKFKKVKE